MVGFPVQGLVSFYGKLRDWWSLSPPFPTSGPWDKTRKTFLTMEVFRDARGEVPPLWQFLWWYLTEWRQWLSQQQVTHGLQYLISLVKQCHQEEIRYPNAPRLWDISFKPPQTPISVASVFLAG